MSHSVRRHLAVEVAAYDEAIRRFIPGYETMVEVAAQEVAASRPDLVLDLGAGTGALASAILKHPEVGAVTLIDVDPEMLAQAQIRLDRLHERAYGQSCDNKVANNRRELSEGENARRHRAEDEATSRVRFLQQSYDDALPRCNAVVASLSLHHIPTLIKKRDLYRRILNALHPGGVFVNADVVTPANSDQSNEVFSAWADHMVAAGIPRQEAYQNFAVWAKEDTYFSLDEELAALQVAGFRPECIWRKGPVAVLVGRK